MIRRFSESLTMIWDFYGPLYPFTVAQACRRYWYEAGEFLAWFWQTKQFRPQRQKRSMTLSEWLLLVGYVSIVGLIIWATVLLFQASRWQLGTALIITYPLVGVHLLMIPMVLTKALWFLVHPKKLFREIICRLLERRVKKLRRRHEFTVVAVAGSIGKTSTKLAIARLLASAGLRVRMQEGNYNDRVTVPLVFFGQELTSLFNPKAWLDTFRQIRRELRRTAFPYDIVVVELGTDGPGQLRKFTYLRPELAVVTAVAEEHMEYFGTLDAVAAEELSVLDFAKKSLVNIDDTPERYLMGKNFTSYGMTARKADFRITKRNDEGLAGQTLTITHKKSSFSGHTVYAGKQGALITLGAAASGSMVGLSDAQVAAGIKALVPFAGRMQILSGVKGSILIDDTYNASPVAVKAALDVLYAAKAPQKIALLGDMNELGEMSSGAHMEIGRYCDASKLDVVVTVGPESKHYLAPEAKASGNTVVSFDSPYEAGEFIKNKLKKGAIVLVKGSQNRVYSEEAIKTLLADPADTAKLVRQSKSWLAKKAKQFPPNS